MRVVGGPDVGELLMLILGVDISKAAPVVPGAEGVDRLADVQGSAHHAIPSHGLHRECVQETGGEVDGGVGDRDVAQHNVKVRL